MFSTKYFNLYIKNLKKEGNNYLSLFIEVFFLNCSLIELIYLTLLNEKIQTTVFGIAIKFDNSLPLFS